MTLLHLYCTNYCVKVETVIQQQVDYINGVKADIESVNPGGPVSVAVAADLLKMCTFLSLFSVCMEFSPFLLMGWTV